MTAALRSFPGAEPAAATVRVFNSFADSENAWRAIEGADAVMTPYQRYDLLSLWQRHIGEPAGVTPFIVVAFDDNGAPCSLWPLGCRRNGPFKVAEFLGGSHVNFNMPIWRRGALADFDETALRNVLSQIGGADALVLKQQPFVWQGTPNPLGALPHAACANSGYRGPLDRDFENLLRSRTSSDTRKKMRKKERALAGHGTVEFGRVAAELMDRALDTFFAQKAARMQERGISDIFSEPDTRHFVDAAVRSGAIELYALTVNDTVVATFGGVVGSGDRFCGMFNSMSANAFRQESPGEQLLVQLVRHCCERGLNTFDLGTGDAAYKALFAPDREALFDSFLPLTPAGKLIALAAQTKGGVKRMIKQNPRLWSAIETARRLRGSLTKA